MMRVTHWIVVVTLMTSQAHAARLQRAASETTRSQPAAVPSNPPTDEHGNTYVTPQRDPSRSSADADVLPTYTGDAWGDGLGPLLAPFVQVLWYLPFGLPQYVLERHGPRAFVYEKRPYAHRSRGIVRTEPIGPVEQREEAAKTRPRVDPEVFDYAPHTENDWWPGEQVAQLEGEGDTDEPVDELEMQSTADYPPMPQPQNAIADWRDGAHSWAAQIQVDAAFIDNDTWRVRPRFRIFTPERLELDGEFAFYHERLSAEDASWRQRTVDWIGMSTAHVAIRFAQSQAVQFRVGIGPRLMTSPDATKLGFDTVYGFDAFIHNPLVASGSIGLGSVGRAFVSDLRIQLGVVFLGIEAYGGWERLSIGHTSLSGPVAGLRYWF